MTLVIKQHTENDFYVTLELDKGGLYTANKQKFIYVVEVCPIHKNNMCGYPIRKMTYAYNDKKKAEATFRRYVKKYCKGE